MTTTTTKDCAKTIRGLFLGSCSPFTDPLVVSEVLSLVPPATSTKDDDDDDTMVHLLYLGTATYDLPLFRSMQTDAFLTKQSPTDGSRRCEVYCLNIATKLDISTEEINHRISTWADIVLVSGGNTLYAIDRWKALGIDVLLRRAALDRGVVVCGGSAGAICWFDGGHSDSADPETFRDAMVKQFAGREVYVPEGGASKQNGIDDDDNDNGDDDTKKRNDSSSSSNIEISAAPAAGEAPKEWSYLRVPALGLLPGLVCPHHDKIQSNGVHRSDDFNAMLLRHPTELGIGIDDWAALVVEGDVYRVLSIEGRHGSVLEEWMGDAKANTLPLPLEKKMASFCKERLGRPGVWIKRVVEDKDSGVLMVKAELCPSEGRLSDLLYHPESIVEEDQAILDKCRADNPQPVQ